MHSFSTKLRLSTAFFLCAISTPGLTSEPDWLNAARASCEQDYGDQRCEDWRFLQKEYAPETIATSRAVAKRAAVRKNRAETRAMREVLIQHTGLCDQDPVQYCPPANYAACAEQLRQTCSSIRLQAALCDQQTARYCAQHRGGDKCVAAMKNQCNSENLSLDQILAKYPELSPAQKARLKQSAQQLEANQNKSIFGRLASGFLSLLGFGS